jgi:RNA polymerase sigma factor (sigma-70 family)
MDRLPHDANAWRRLMHRVARLTRRPADAEDLLHSAFLRLHAYSLRNTVDNPAAFLVRTAVNLSIDDVRQKRSRGETLVDANDLGEIADNEPLQDEVLASRNRLEKVRQALGQLTPRTRTIFLMHRVEGLKYREIAARLDITMSAVEKHIAKAVLHLATHADEFER